MAASRLETTERTKRQHTWPMQGLHDRKANAAIVHRPMWRDVARILFFSKYVEEDGCKQGEVQRVLQRRTAARGCLQGVRQVISKKSFLGLAMESRWSFQKEMRCLLHRAKVAGKERAVDVCQLQLSQNLATDLLPQVDGREEEKPSR